MKPTIIDSTMLSPVLYTVLLRLGVHKFILFPHRDGGKISFRFM